MFLLCVDDTCVWSFIALSLPTDSLFGETLYRCLRHMLHAYGDPGAGTCCSLGGRHMLHAYGDPGAGTCCSLGGGFMDIQ